MNVTLERQGKVQYIALQPENAGDRMMIGTLTIQLARDRVQHALHGETLQVWVREGGALQDFPRAA